MVTDQEIDAMSEEELDDYVAMIMEDDERIEAESYRAVKVLARFIADTGLDEAFLNSLTETEMVSVVVALEAANS